jgi:saxitoxin biosynthesis operon SxtJ-like protein
LAHRSPARLSPGEGRKFALTLTAAFAVLAAVSWWRAHPRTSTVFAVVAAVLLLAGLAVPTRLGPVRDAWMGLAHVISKVTTPIFMSILYFLVITPSALIRRLVGGNPLRRSQGKESGWIDRRDSPPRDLSRQF